MFNQSDPAMHEASIAAQRSFKYFWRELSWEQRRIIPGLEMSAVKLPFSDGPATDERPEHEMMWVSDVDFDGETLSGRLLNNPNWITSVHQGDEVKAPFTHLADWMMAANGQAYGAYTVNLMRSKMSNRERRQHDEAWGLDFGDPGTVRVEIEHEKKPKPGLISSLFNRQPKSPTSSDVFADHPMCLNMLEKIEEQLKSNPSLANSAHDRGCTLMHLEALAGNFAVVKLLVRHGADVTMRTLSGRTASELAKNIGWSEISEFLDSHSPA